MFQKTVLPNGVRIISEKLEHFRSVSLGIWVDVGSRDESEEENGISHFIEHMSFKGTRKRNGLDIAKELDAIGGLSNAFTGKEYTCFHSKVLYKHFEILADILSDLFLDSLFDPLEMDRERQVILQEVKMVEDTPDEYIHDLFQEQFFKGHPLSRSVLGHERTIAAIQRETILTHIENFYRPEKIVIAAAGQVDHRTLVGYFQPLFEGLSSNHRPAERQRPQTRQGLVAYYKDLEQAHICLGGRAPFLASESRFAAAICNTILGGNMSSRLFQEIREKRGLAYNVYSFLSAHIDAGMLGIYVGIDPAKANEALEIIQREVIKIKQGAITPEELAAAKNYLIGSILLGSESTDSRMMRITKNEFVFGRYMGYDEIVESLEKATLDEVVAVAHDTFQKEGISLVTLGAIKDRDLDPNHIHF
ncbi:MAG: insulinase family protein [Desulfobacteraceae bacterium]|nr:MAG: insulinase family protein [Desulfobacteraceae bacterium]